MRERRKDRGRKGTYRDREEEKGRKSRGKGGDEKEREIEGESER